MMETVLWGEYRRNPFQAGLKMAIPTVLVAAGALIGYAGLVLAVLIAFTGITGSSIGIVKMKIGGMYRRLIVSPAGKPRLFSEFMGVQASIYTLQLVPSLVIVSWLDGPLMLGWGIASIAFAVVLGTLVGMVSNQLGTVHLNALLVTGPLIGLSLAPTAAAAALPFSYLAGTAITGPPALLPFALLISLYGGLLFYADRL